MSKSIKWFAHFYFLQDIYRERNNIRKNKIKIMKYLKKFSNHTDYEAAESSLILPNVSLCVQENEVHYNPIVPPIIDGHEYVDFGLPSGTKWATMNVGASSETDYGNYYKYGLGASQYDNAQTDYSGTENPLASSADTAVQVWGGSWHMPTQTQWQELTVNTDYSWTTINGVNGGKFTSKTDSSKYIFLPANGVWHDGSLEYVGDDGSYWSSTPDDSSYAYGLYLDSSDKYVKYSFRRSDGLPVRPVVG